MYAGKGGTYNPMLCLRQPYNGEAGDFVMNLRNLVLEFWSFRFETVTDIVDTGTHKHRVC